MIMKNKLELFCKKLDLKFKDSNLLERVFIHRSYLNENKKLSLEHNERLEFLGDAVIELAVTEYLYQNFTHPEGVLTNFRSALVRGRSLSDEAKKIGLDELLQTSRGEAKNSGKAKDLLLANAFEALVGAIYLDNGFEIAKKFIDNHIIYKLETVIKTGQNIDPKGHFQELAQEKFSITPTYKVIDESGPDHNKQFNVATYLGNKIIAHGSGSSKQDAQIEAAREALKLWDSIEL